MTDTRWMRFDNRHQFPGAPGKLNCGRPFGKPGIPGGVGAPAPSGAWNNSGRLNRSFE